MQNDLFRFEVGELIPYMDYEDCKDLIKPEVTCEQWNQMRLVHSREALIKVMLEYMPFAWEKANGCRGISANRSVMHYIGWTWLAGEGELSQTIDRVYNAEYQHYGKEILVLICEHFGWSWKQWDDGVWTNGED
jgi:hypothetical protein